MTNVLGALLVGCDDPLCSEVTELKHLRYRDYTVTLLPSKLTIQNFLTRPLKSLPTAVEQKAAAMQYVVKKLMHTSSSAIGYCLPLL